MTFDQWLNRPVYKVQVHTFNILRQILSLPAGNLATFGEHPLLHFRVLPAHRSAYSLALRKRVADQVRESRRNKTCKLKRVAP